MIETPKLVTDLSSAIWHHVQRGSDHPLSTSHQVRHVIDRSADTERASELYEFVERLDDLPAAQLLSFTASMDEVQVSSKLWLIEELTSRRDLDGALVVVLGAWYGVLPMLLNWVLDRRPARMVCVDIDATACALGERVIGAMYRNIDYEVADVMGYDYEAVARHRSAVLINTICEHLPDVPAWWRRVAPGQLTVMQSNNYDACPDHVNWVPGLAEMKAQTPLSEQLYEGVLPLPIFDRFMLIGYR